MTRLKTLPIVLGLLLLTAGAALAFAPLPEAAHDGLQRASEAAEKPVPARPTAAPADAPTTTDAEDDASAADGTDADSHGKDVRAVATADDTTPDTNHGADVSAVARQNHGQATAEEHRPDHAGKPEGVGKPEGAGKPDDAGKPGDAGKPDGAGKPEGAGKPDAPGQPADPGKPEGAGRP